MRRPWNLSSSGGEVEMGELQPWNLSASGGEVGERSEPGEVVSCRGVPASSTGSGGALTDFSSTGGEVEMGELQPWNLSALGERSVRDANR